MSSTAIPQQPRYISLKRWAELRFDPVPHPNTLRRWVADGMITPAPFKVGREYMVLPTARHVEEPAPGKSLVDRLKHGLASA
jgi:hypothetical protein